MGAARLHAVPALQRGGQRLRSHVQPRRVVGGNQAKYVQKAPLRWRIGRAAARPEQQDQATARTRRRSRRGARDEETSENAAAGTPRWRGLSSAVRLSAGRRSKCTAGPARVRYGHCDRFMPWREVGRSLTGGNQASRRRACAWRAVSRSSGSAILGERAEVLREPVQPEGPNRRMRRRNGARGPRCRAATHRIGRA